MVNFLCHFCIYCTHILGIVATIGIGGNWWNQQMDRRSDLLSTPHQGVESCVDPWPWFPLRCGNHIERCPLFAELYDTSYKRFCRATPTQSTRRWSLTCTEERRLKPPFSENNLETGRLFDPTHMLNSRLERASDPRTWAKAWSKLSDWDSCENHVHLQLLGQR